MQDWALCIGIAIVGVMLVCLGGYFIQRSLRRGAAALRAYQGMSGGLPSVAGPGGKGGEGETEDDIAEVEPEPAEPTMPSSDPPELPEEDSPVQSVSRGVAPRRSGKPTSGSVKIPVIDLCEFRARLVRLRSMVPAGDARQLIVQCIHGINEHVASDEEIVAASLRRPFWRRAG